MLHWIVWNKNYFWHRNCQFTLNWIVWNRTVSMYKMDLVLNNLQRLMSHKTKPNQTNLMSAASDLPLIPIRKELIDEIQAMIDQLVNQVHSLKIWFSYQTSCTWRYSLFLIQDEKGNIFITGHEQEERLHWKFFWTSEDISSNWTCFGFFTWEKFLQDQTVNSQNNKMYWNWRKPNILLRS